MKKKHRHPNQEGKSKIVSVYRYIILHIENPEESTKKYLELTNEFSKVEG